MHEPSRHWATYCIAGLRHGDGALALGEPKPGTEQRVLQVDAEADPWRQVCAGPYAGDAR